MRPLQVLRFATIARDSVRTIALTAEDPKDLLCCTSEGKADQRDQRNNVSERTWKNFIAITIVLIFQDTYHRTHSSQLASSTTCWLNSRKHVKLVQYYVSP